MTQRGNQATIIRKDPNRPCGSSVGILKSMIVFFATVSKLGEFYWDSVKVYMAGKRTGLSDFIHSVRTSCQFQSLEKISADLSADATRMNVGNGFLVSSARQ